MKKILCLLLLAGTVPAYSQSIAEIQELDTYRMIAGPNVGYGGKESPQWKLYTIIMGKYASELIENEYFKTASVITKVYLYWILRERNWHNLPAVHEDLMHYKDTKVLFAPGGCIVLDSIEIEHVIDFNYHNREYYIDEHNTDYSVYFDPQKTLELNERLYREMMLERLKLPLLPEWLIQ
jgi:hypothetical protein